jgi:ankyrin repeat protein
VPEGKRQTKGAKTAPNPNSWKYHALNRVKIQCTPVGRSWPEQKCDRCLAKGLPCGPNIRSRKRSRGDAAGGGASDVSGPTAPATPSHLIGTNVLLTPPSTGSDRTPLVSTAVHDETFTLPTTLQRSPCLRFGIENDSQFAAPERASVTRNKRSLSCKYANPIRLYDWRGWILIPTSSSHAYLGFLRILYEIVRCSQKAVNPNDFALRHGQNVHGRLVSMAGNIVQEYKSKLWQFIAQTHDEEYDQTELRLLKAIQGIRFMNALADKEMFRDHKIHIYERLISIYKAESDEPEVERYMILLEELSKTEHTPDGVDNTIASQIAESMKRTSQELISVSDEMSRNLESHLLDSRWLHNSPTPFPPLLRALRAGLDRVSEILAKEEKGLIDCDLLKRMASQVAAECGNTKFLEENFRDKPHLKACGDILNHTALFAAAAHGKLETFQSLVRTGDHLNLVRDIDGATLMDVVAAGGYTEFARYLLSLGYDVKRPSLAAASPLHTAAERGHTEFCELLLDANVDAGGVFAGPDGNGYTAALVAYRKSCEAVNSAEKEKFYSLALRIAEAEGPPHNSLQNIQRQRGETIGSPVGQTQNALRSLGPSPFMSDNELHPIGGGGFRSSASINNNWVTADETPSSIHALDDSPLPSDTNPRLVGHNDCDDPASTYSDSHYSFMSASMSRD